MALHPAVLISVTSNWFDSDDDARQMQRRQIEAWTRHWRIPLIRAPSGGINQQKRN
ncbi:hypothetical protein [Burkholderia gladioli]|uniref:hypothetical protein n=1 Tax=Burkholderia gladioli TaxID=28095 RepID=UPI001C5F0C49|nr:hypothetical protein [Burkholderia gladioli]MBW5284209.1 hypothetical protein [Burkholderia gladioli]